MVPKHIMFLSIGTGIGILLANMNPFFVFGENMGLFFILLVGVPFTLVTERFYGELPLDNIFLLSLGLT